MPTILIVDDDQYNREVLQDGLGGNEFEIIEATNGKEALAAAVQNPPDLILLDLTMPVMDGIDCLKSLKGNPKTENIPVIMVSALGMDSQVAACLDEGAADYIVKPFSTLVVRARVRAVLRDVPGEQGTGSDQIKAGHVVGFFGVKGGVGTSTVAVNVAAALQKQGKNTAIVDFRQDFSGIMTHLGLLPNFKASMLGSDETDCIDGKAIGSCLIDHATGIKVLAVADYNAKEHKNLPAATVNNILEKFEQNFEYTVVDLPPCLDETTQAAIKKCSTIVLVLEMEPIALQAAKVMLEKLHSLGIPGSIIYAVVTCRARAFSPVNLGHIRSELSCGVVGVVPPDPDACMTAIAGGMPILLSQPRTMVAGALNSLADRLIKNSVTPLTF